MRVIRLPFLLFATVLSTLGMAHADNSEQYNSDAARPMPSVSAHYRRLHGHCFEQRTVLLGDAHILSSSGLTLDLPNLQVSRRLTPCPEVVLLEGATGTDAAWKGAEADAGGMVDGL